MGFEFKINEELAAIATTSAELLSITRSIKAFVKNKEFLDLFDGVMAEINKSYPVVLDSFSPFTGLDSELSFTELFDDYHNTFKSCYLLEASKPRRYCDNVYDAYLQMQRTKEAKSQFPLLKRNFERLETLYDKWITNDALLAMSIDGVLKLQNRLLNEIAEVKSKDVEDAYLIFSAAMDCFAGNINLIMSNSESISTIVANVPSLVPSESITSSAVSHN